MDVVAFLRHEEVGEENAGDEDVVRSGCCCSQCSNDDGVVGVDLSL